MVARVTRPGASRELILSVDILLGACATTILAPAIWGSLRVHVSPHYEPTRMKKELLGGSESDHISRPWYEREDMLRTKVTEWVDAVPTR